ncbi:MAG: tetratricopeptide repeat protein [Sulfuricaulis sp.]
MPERLFDMKYSILKNRIGMFRNPPRFGSGMRVARFLPLFPLQPENKHRRASALFVLILFVLGSQVAPLMSRDYIWDDLIWYWTYRHDGTKLLFDYLDQVGHPSFWPFLDFAYRVFGADATLPTTVISLVFHTANAFLVSRLTYFLSAGRIPAYLAFVFYLMSPYYFNRGTVSHYFYDVFMFLWLSSVYLGAPGNTTRFKQVVAAPVCQIMSCGLPTLIMLEPFRLMVYMGLCGRDYRKLAGSIAPYWGIAVVCAMGAYFLFKPEGYYEGYNRLRFSIPLVLQGMSDYATYLPKAVNFHLENAFALLRQPLDWPFVALLIAAGAGFVGMMPVTDPKNANRNAVSMLLMSALLFVSGALPYILAGRILTPGNFDSRLFFVSGFACVVAGSIALAKIPSIRARTLLVTALVSLFLVSGLQQGKAYMYDYLVRQTVLSEIRAYMHNLGQGEQASRDMFIGLTAEPAFWELSSQNRIYTSPEFSVPLNMDEQSRHGRWFVYYLDFRFFSPPDYVLPPRECAFAAHDRQPCPKHYLVMEYKVNVAESGIANFSFMRIFFESFLAERPMQIGHLAVLIEPRPMNINAMAARWFLKEAEEGNADAQNWVGLMYLDGFADIPRDDARAFGWFQKSSAQDNLRARINLGLMYLRGRGVEKNEELAAQLIHAAAERGNATAQYNYGLLCERGLCGANGEREAFAWHLKAAEQGHVLAQARIGSMYARGAGTPRNEAMALKWLRKAADKSNLDAQYALALLLYNGRDNGRDVPGDLQAAIELFRRAADRGHVAAQLSLATLYEHGVGVSKDAAESYFWYQLASRYGNTPDERKSAQQAGKVVAALLAEDDIRMLNQRLRDWRPVESDRQPVWTD